jgi:hypothetical protein
MDNGQVDQISYNSFVLLPLFSVEKYVRGATQKFPKYINKNC